MTLWDLGEVDVCLTQSIEHVLIIQGKFIKNGENSVWPMCMRLVTVDPSVVDVSFNSFIEDNVLVGFPLCRRHFTWYCGNGRVMSKLDRFLMTEEWCVIWPNCT